MGVSPPPGLRDGEGEVGVTSSLRNTLGRKKISEKIFFKNLHI